MQIRLLAVISNNLEYLLSTYGLQSTSIFFCYRRPPITVDLTGVHYKENSK